MRKLALWFFAIFCFASISSLAEDFKRPTRTAAEATPEQKALLKEGIELHDKGDYDGAIKKYESILSINPDNVSAIYEMGFSYFAKQDYKKALEINENGVEYTSNILSQFYMQIASCLDNLGNWEKAIDIYNKVIKEFPQEGLVHFNLALTYSQHQKPELAISNLKEELYLNPSHPTSHLLLGALFKNNDYRIPAIFALSRFLILEPQSGRSANALAGLQDLINGGVVAKDEKNISIYVDPKGKKDEGDFDSLQMALSLVSAGRFLEINADKSMMDKEVEQFRSFFQIMLEMIGKDKDKLKFIGKYYVPYFLAMHEQGYVKTFVYFIHASSKDKDVHDWLDKNMEQVRAFRDWNKKYQWSHKKG